MAPGADAEPGGVGAHRPELHQRLLQHGDVLAQPLDSVHRSLPGPPRRTAHPDRRRPEARPAQHAGGDPRAGRDPAAAGLPAPPGASRLRPRGAAADDGRGRAGALALHSESRRNAPLGRLRGRLQGQVASDPAARAERLGRWRRREDRAGLRVRRLGPARRRGERQGRELRGRQRRATRPGLGRALHPRSRALAGPGRSPRALLPGGLAGQPARRPRLPGLLPARRLHGRRLPRPRGRACRRRSTRT